MKTTATTAKKRKWRIWSLGVLMVLIGVPALLFVTASWSVNRMRIPAEMEKMPPELAAGAVPAERRAVGNAVTGTTASFSLARRTRGDREPRKRGDGYELFLEAELRERPELEGARLYLELIRRYNSSGGRKEFNLFGRTAKWQAGQPLPPDHIELLRAHADIVEQFMHFAESSGLPVRTAEIIAQDANPAVLGLPDFSLIRRGVIMLAAEGQRRLEEGDPGAAERTWCVAIKTSVNLGREPFLVSKMFGITCLNDVFDPLENWISRGRVSRDALGRLQAALAEVHCDFFTPGWIAVENALIYPAGRKEIIAELNRSRWSSRTFGWNVNDVYQNQYYSFSVMNVELPRVDRITIAALRSMRYKQQSARILRDFDQNYLEINRRARMTWPEVIQAGPYSWPKDNTLFEEPQWNQFSGFTGGKDPLGPIVDNEARVLASETRLNLLRAAIGWKLGGVGGMKAGGMKEDGTMESDDRESPWRDPFTEKPLKETDTTTRSTRIYSLGPDMQDQGGRVLYDPTNGTTSAGDLVIEVGR